MTIPEKAPELIALRQKGGKTSPAFQADDPVHLIGTIPDEDIEIAQSNLSLRNWWRWQISNSGRRFMNFLLGRNKQSS